MPKEFWLSKDVIPLAEITNSYISSFAKSNAAAKMYGGAEDLAIYSLIELAGIYESFYGFSDVKDDVYVFATIARSSQEICFDYLYAVNSKDSEEKTALLLKVHRSGARVYVEYFDYMKGLITEEQMFARPKWTKANQMQRIEKHGGFEELAFYNVLCSLTHHSIPNERFIQHPNEIYMLRSYLLAKIIKYNYLVARTCLNSVDFKNKRLEQVLVSFVEKIDANIESWKDLLAGMYGLRDHEDHKHGDLTGSANK